MAKRTERRFGEIPDWAKTGPIDTKNYDYRAEWHCADRSSKRGGAHPIIKLGSLEFVAWHEYFAVHLGGLPWAMKALLSGQIESMTVPEGMPQWFDPSFAPTLGYRPVLPRDPDVSDEEAARIRAKFADLLRSMGRNMSPVAGGRHRFARHSDDDLRARYAKPEAAA